MPRRYDGGMTVPELSLSPRPLLEIEGDVLVLGVLKTEDGPRLLTDDPELAGLQPSLGDIGLTGSQDEVRRLPRSHGIARSMALVGLGSGSDGITANDLRYAAGSAARQLRGVGSLVLGLPAHSDEQILAVLEGAALGAYAYTEYRGSSLEAAKLPATSIIVATDAVIAQSPAPGLVERALATAVAVHTVRDLVNTPPSDLYPETFADSALALATGLDVAVEVLADAELRAGGFGGILAVGQGSVRGPRLVRVSYSPDGAGKHLALVGKGITFDSGGLSLKPPASMIGMKYDMTGAATALAVTLAAARLSLPVRITAWLCIAENMPGGGALRPGDVIRIHGGKTVEVLNTDAEGRLVMADGLVAASEDEPDAIVDVATLTGAASIAMGTRYVAAMGDTALAQKVVAAADRVGETFWHMPIPADLRPLLASDIADIANIKPGNTAGGMMIAAAFLRDFVPTTIPWAHLDIAGSANNGGGGWGFTGKGPTGVSVRALLELAEEYSRS